MKKFNGTENKRRFKMLNQIQYPGINFWDKKAEKISFINREDFREKKLLRLLGVASSELENSFGVVDRKEILKRQRLIKFFVKHPKALNFLIHEGSRAVSLPTSGQAFLDYFNPKIRHNSFWVIVRRFVSMVSCYKTIPPEIKSFVSFLKKIASFLEKEEKQMAKGIIRRASKAAYLEGAITFSIDIGRYTGICFDKEKNYSEVYGYKLYSQELSSLKRYEDITTWLSKKFWRKIGVFRLINLILKARIKQANKKLYSPLQIMELPECILEEIRNFLENNLRAVLFPRSEKGHSEIDLQIFFRYSEDGLRIRVLGISTKESDKKEDQKTYISFLKQEFSGYSRKMIKKMAKKNKTFNEQAEQADKKVYNYQLLGAMRDEFPDLFRDSMQLIHSSITDNRFKWHSIANLYAHSDFSETYSKSSDFRNYFGSTMKSLQLIAELANSLLNKSKAWKMPLCFPVILDDHNHLVSFESLEPIHLFSEEEKEELVTIKSLPALNGQLIGLTGQNKGGKSTTEEAIVNAIYLAQSGLPVFGKKFALNVKNKIGMVFLERGSGSTLEMLLRKTKRILEQLDGSKRNGTVLILDEVGTGTQEIDGFSYGKKLLEKLSKSFCSIIFSTQIIDLAKYAQDKLGAECFNFDLKHRIRPGIGRGGIEKLMSEIGIEELLN